MIVTRVGRESPARLYSFKPEDIMATRPITPRLLPAILFTLALLAPAHAALACPQNCFWTPVGTDFCTPAATLDTLVDNDPGGLCSGSHRAKFDMPNGTLGSFSGSPFGGCTPRTTVHDDFTLLGIPNGTPVPLTARLFVTATVSTFLGDGTADAQITEGGANSAAVHWDIVNDFSHLGGPPPWMRGIALSVPFVAIAGTPFPMEYWVGSTLGEGCSVAIVAAFTFDGLPQGASLVSCKGFVEAPTAAQPASWGSVKAHYR
jgi:hypothetical protein